MAVVRRTAGAEEDLVDIWLYIAADNPNAADLLLEKIDRKCMLLAGNPLPGRTCPEIAPELRYLPIVNDLILYREFKEGIEVVHDARRLEGLL
jgi:toxin ParE1/3/4